MEHVAVIADIHADWSALQAVAAAIEDVGVERVWCLGDWCSGGPKPVECFDWVTSRCERILSGNHEVFVLGRVWESGPRSDWAQAAEYAYEKLGQARLAQLLDYDAHDLTQHAELVHGALTGPIGDFIQTPMQAERNLKLLDRPMLLFAHTHQAALWEPNGNRGARGLPLRIGFEYRLSLSPSLEARRLLNPGAVCDAGGARWLELRLEVEGCAAVWHQTAVRGHGGIFSVER